jgi:flagellar FliJ protein
VARFRFELEALLAMRLREERLCMTEFAAIERQRYDLEENLRSKQREIGQVKQTLREGLVGSVNVGLIRQHAAATIAVDRLARQTVLELAGLSRKADAARQRLVAASQRRRAVEILRERRFEEWKRDADRKETAFLDDLSNIARAREAAAQRGDDSALGSHARSERSTP